MKTNRIIIGMLLLLPGIIAYSQKKSNIRFEHLGIEKGLSQSNVTCILQDSRGFMWFGTRDGLNKYDGYKFTVYKNNADDQNTISNDYIQDLAESRDGSLWIATRGGGLNRYDRETNRFSFYKHDPKNKNSISSNIVNAVIEDVQGNMWMGTEDGGLNFLETKTGRFIAYTPGRDNNTLSDLYIRDVLEDSQQNLWIATNDGGLNLFDRKTNTFTRFQHDQNDPGSISSNSIYTIFEDSKQRLWIGTIGGGLDRLDRSGGKFNHYRHNPSNDNSLANDYVHAINEANDNLWIGTENGGLSILDPEENLFTNYANNEFDNTSLSNNSIYSICRDNKNNIWVGTFNAGLNIVNRDAVKFTHYKHIPFKNSLSYNKVLCIYEDSKDNIWICTDGGGLDMFDPRTSEFTNYRHQPGNKNSLSGNYVLGVREDSKGNLWVGTWANGITVFNRASNSFTHFKNEPGKRTSLSSNNAWAIFEDRNRNMWIGTHGGGLNLFDPVTNSFSSFQYNKNDPFSLSNNNVHSIFEDSDGYLWISTEGGGLNRFDKRTRTFTRFIHDDKKNSISNNNVGAVFEDTNGNLWISTLAGLNLLDRKTNTFTVYTTKDGLPNNTIFGILADNNNNLWISSNKGISKFNTLEKSFKNFGVADGLQSNEFKEQAFCKSRYGTMYFGGNNGFNQFSPYNVRDIAFEPPLLITGFQVFNKDVAIAGTGNPESPLKKDISETREITLSYKNSVVSFEFASLNYTSAEKKQYAYMLEGFDHSWNEIGTKRTATYTNLDPGSYTFKVKGLNNEGKWSDAVTSVKLTITPPFWQTWWFKTGAFVFILGCLVTFYRIRVKAITKQKVQLENQVKERTAEVVMQKEELSKNVEELALLKEDLEKEKYFLDCLMDNMPDSIYFKDRESRVIRASKYMSGRFRHLVDNLIGKSDFDFQDKEHAQEAFEDEQKIQQTRTPKIDYIERELTKDGTEAWVSTTKMPLINGQGEVVGTFGISRDVTRIKNLERERHDAIVEQAVAQGKFEIASDVMHDIGNAVVGFGSYLTRIRRMQNEDTADNLKNLSAFFNKQRAGLVASIGEAKADAVVKLLDSMAETQKTNQGEINHAITEQLNIINSIQEILNIQRQYITGHESQERKPVNLRHVISDSLAILNASIDKMAIDVSLNVDPELPILKGDRTKLMQALLSILRNSIEAIDADAPEKKIHVKAFTDSGQLVLQVKDNGKGFDAEAGKQIFKKGFTTKESSSGTGLYNSRIIAESHSACVDISSDGPGKGAITTVKFKIAS